MSKEKNNRTSYRQKFQRKFFYFKFKVRNKFNGNKQVSFKEMMRNPKEVLFIKDEACASLKFWITFPLDEKIEKNMYKIVKIRLRNDEQFIVSQIKVFYGSVYSIESYIESLSKKDLIEKYKSLLNLDGFIIVK